MSDYMRRLINKVEGYKKSLNENLSQDELNYILDKISEKGIDSLSNHEKTLLKSYSDSSIDAEEEIQKHLNKYKTAKEVIKTIPLQVSDEELEKNIGRYIKFKPEADWRKNGLLTNMGAIYEIIAVQKHWGHIDGVYRPDKVGYRVARVGVENDFGRVADVDNIEFVNMPEEEAIAINQQIDADIDSGNYPDWYYKS